MGTETQITQRKAWYIVFISSLLGCSISATFPQFSMTVGILAEKTGMSEEFLLTGDTIKSAAIVLAMLCSGFLYKKLGAKACLVIALLCTSIPQFWIPYATSPALFMMLKIVQGLSSIIFPVFLLIIMDVISLRHAGLATAVFNGIFYSGGGVGGTLAGFFITRYGWISSYLSIGILEVVLGVLWLLTVTVPSKADSDSPPSSAVAQTTKGSSLSLLRNPVVWLLILAFLSTTFVIQAITVDMPLFSQWLGYDDMETAKITTAVTIGLLVSCLISGRVSDQFALRGRNKAKIRILVLSMGQLIIIGASLLLIFADLKAFGLFYFVAFLFSFGGSWGLGTFYVILPEIFDRETLPIVTGVAGGAGDLGMPAAPFLVGVLFGAKGMWHLGWSVCIGIALISFMACALLYFKKGLVSGQRGQAK